MDANVIVRTKERRLLRFKLVPERVGLVGDLTAEEKVEALSTLVRVAQQAKVAPLRRMRVEREHLAMPLPLRERDITITLSEPVRTVGTGRRFNGVH